MIHFDLALTIRPRSDEKHVFTWQPVSGQTPRESIVCGEPQYFDMASVLVFVELQFKILGTELEFSARTNDKFPCIWFARQLTTGVLWGPAAIKDSTPVISTCEEQKTLRNGFWKHVRVCLCILNWRP